uniref:Uncharacterized protein n=1 Tax=Romanomermis culicivorax TaxID=13658 RepID=A0A915HND0_ROMCU
MNQGPPELCKRPRLGSDILKIGTKSEDDNSSEELKNWFNQMKSYEKFYNKAVEKSPDNIKLTFMNDFQLCSDTTYTQEAFQECLEFCTQSRDHTLKVTITYDGEIWVKSSLYMEKLKEVVESCFISKMLANDFIRRIWDLFKETFCE